MNKRKSIVFKYFALCTAVILISFICLGAVLLLVSSRYFIDEKKNQMIKNTQALVEYTEQRLKQDASNWKDAVATKMQEYSISSSTDYIMCSSTGYIICNTASSQDSNPTLVKEQGLEAFSDKCSYFYGNCGGTFAQDLHITGMSFSGNGPVYYMLAYSSKTQQESYMWNIAEVFIISTLGVLAVAMFLVYIVTLKFTDPIKEIAEVAKKISNGDFSATAAQYDVAEYAQLANAFNEMAAGLKNYDTMRNSFLANVSHELRTPMTSMSGFVDGLLDGTIPKQQEKYYLRIISSEVHRLARLVRSMLNLAKIEAGELKPNMTVFSVFEPIVDTLVTFEQRIDQKRIEIQGLDVDRVNLYADNDLVHQVMYNLIENAIKFVDEGGYIRFTFTPTGDMTVISIKNSGEGLSEDELPLVFDRFYKTDKSRGLDKTGVGLGLNIVRSIIKLHGGKIMVRSVKGEYTEFIFTLPNKPTDD